MPKQENRTPVPVNERGTRKGRRLVLPRLLVPAVAMLVAGSALFAATTAWITQNRRVRSKGLEMTAQTTANLVIGTSSADVKKTNILASDSPFAVTFPANSRTFLPATHNEEAGTGLYYVTPTAGKNVDVKTGLAKSGVIQQTYVEAAADSPYYCDYVVYIAATEAALVNATLHISVTATNLPAGGLSDTAKALSVDFYLNGVSKQTYFGTLNLAGYDTATYDPWRNTKTEITTAPMTIPKNTGTPLQITMRVYYDGALKKDAVTALVRSAAVTPEKIGFRVDFSATVQGESS